MRRVSNAIWKDLQNVLHSEGFVHINAILYIIMQNILHLYNMEDKGDYELCSSNNLG